MSILIYPFLNLISFLFYFFNQNKVKDTKGFNEFDNLQTQP